MNEKRPSSRAAAAPAAALLVLALPPTPLPAQLFDNLQALEERILVGDPAVASAGETEGPKGIAAADFDRDGRPDLAVSNLDGTVTVLRNAGGGAFAGPDHLQTGAQSLRAVVAADLDGDGAPDIAVAAPFDAAVFLFFNDGSGRFPGSERVRLDAWAGARNLAAGDFDGDGVTDLAAAGPGNGLRHYRGTGGGAFEVMGDVPALDAGSTDFPKPVYTLRAITSRDGRRDDLVVTHAESGQIWVLGTAVAEGLNGGGGGGGSGFFDPSLQANPGGAAASSPVIITEFMAANTRTLADGDGDYSDWVELYNRSDRPVSLGGWALADGSEEHWEFSPTGATIDPGNFLLVFASGKGADGPEGELHTGFKLSAGGERLALLTILGAPAHTVSDDGFPGQLADVSYGFGWDGSATYFDLPSPGAPNNGGVPRRDQLRAARLSAVSFYPADFGPDDPVLVEITLEVTETYRNVWFVQRNGTKETTRTMADLGGGGYAVALPAGVFRRGEAFHIIVERGDGRIIRLRQGNGPLAEARRGALRPLASLPGQPARALVLGAVSSPAGAGAEPDLITANRDSGQLEIRRPLDHAGRFHHRPWRTLQVTGGPRAVAVVDMDADGWNDLVVALRNFDRVVAFRNGGDGTFELASEIPTGASPREIATADFDGDGHTDAAVINRVSADVSVLRGFGEGATFQVLDQIYPTDAEVAGLTVQDIDGDGRDDVVQLHRKSGDISVRRSGPGGRLEPPTYVGVGLSPEAFAINDFDNDGRQDVVVANLAAPGSVSVRPGLAGGGFGPERRYELPPGQRGSLFAVVPGDFDGDGNLDLAAGYFDCRLAFYRGRGDGTFAFTRTTFFTYEARRMVAGDFDLDGDIDLAGAGYAGDVVVFENEGDMMTSTRDRRTDYPAPFSRKFGSRDMVAADLDGDGDLDLAVGSGSGSLVYYGEAGMGFRLAPEVELLRDLRVSGVVSADFDGDGREDLAASCRLLSCIEIQTQAAGGGFVPALVIDVPSANYLAAGDLDGDGQADLVGAGDVLWTALSSRRATRVPHAPENARRTALDAVVINEILAVNNGIPLEQDGGKRTDFLELYNATGERRSLAGWSLVVEPSGDSPGGRFDFPAGSALDPSSHLVVAFSADRRSPYHTGFKLSGEGTTLSLRDPAGAESDRVTFGRQRENVSYGRYPDGGKAFTYDPIPSPGAANTDNGAVEPAVRFGGFTGGRPGSTGPLRASARGEDDSGIVSLSLLYQLRGDPGATLERAVLYDDGMHGDGGRLDGFFSGLIAPQNPLPPGAEFDFFLEATDLSGVTVTVPAEPDSGDATGGSAGGPFSFALAAGPDLRIVRVVADNRSGLRDEAGGTPDYVEIWNATAVTVDLAGVSLTRGYRAGAGDRFDFPGGSEVGPGGRVTVFLDANTDQGPLHAPFRADRGGDDLLLLGTAPLGARIVLDAVTTPRLGADEALARLGGTDLWSILPAGGNAPDLATPWTGAAFDSAGSPVLAYVFPTEPGLTYRPESSVDGAAWEALPVVVGTREHGAAAVPLPAGSEPWARTFRHREERPAVTAPSAGELRIVGVTRNSVEVAGTILETGGETPEVTLILSGIDNSIGPQGGDFSFLFEDLEPGSDYTVRGQVTNSGGNFLTGVHPASTLPASFPSIKNGEVEVIDTDRANVRATIDDAGSPVGEVTLYWGALDGGTAPAAWPHAIRLNPRRAGEVSAGIDGLVPDRTYAFRWRVTTATGAAWSARTSWFESATRAELLRRDLAVTEVMYNPQGGYRYEFIELQNVGPAALGLTGVRLDGAVAFDLGCGDNPALAPGGRLVVVANRQAFEERYGRGLPVTGEWTRPFDQPRLSNRRENLALTYRGAVLHSFTYEDRGGWPGKADGAGSLVLIDPASRPDHAVPTSWGARSRPGRPRGRPGSSSISAAWKGRRRNPVPTPMATASPTA